MVLERQKNEFVDRLKFTSFFRSERKLLKFISFRYSKIKPNFFRRGVKVYRKAERVNPLVYGLKARLYNGRLLRNVNFNKSYDGFLMGEFSFTRRFGFGVDIHKKKKKKV